MVLSHDVDIAAARAVYARQRRLAVTSMAALVLLVLGLPLLVVVAPELARLRLGDVPASWLLVGVVPYPALLAVSWVQLRAAERAEREDGDRG